MALECIKGCFFNFLLYILRNNNIYRKGFLIELIMDYETYILLLLNFENTCKYSRKIITLLGIRFSTSIFDLFGS